MRRAALSLEVRASENDRASACMDFAFFLPHTQHEMTLTVARLTIGSGSTIERS